MRVGVDDLSFVGTSACGAQYRSESTGNGICYGRATWVDARGVRTEVPWSIDRSGIAMRVRDEVLEASAYPAVLDPIIGPEIEVGDFAWGPTVEEERLRDVASIADRTLVRIAGRRRPSSRDSCPTAPWAMRPRFLG